VACPSPSPKEIRCLVDQLHAAFLFIQVQSLSRSNQLGKKRKKKKWGITTSVCQLTGTSVRGSLVDQPAAVPKRASLHGFSPTQTRRDLYEISLSRSRYPKRRRLEAHARYPLIRRCRLVSRSSRETIDFLLVMRR